MARRASASSDCSICWSSISKWPAMLASSGNWWRIASQKAWMVWIFRPPGVSSASANSLRARRSLSAPGRAPSSLWICSASLVVVERRPAGEVLIDALGHVGGGGPRIGQAQDLRGIGAAQQQPDDAARQHMRLAGPGIGRHPDRMPGIGGNRLPPRRFIGDQVRMLHSASPGSSSPPADHSSTRAR